MRTVLGTTGGRRMLALTVTVGAGCCVAFPAMASGNDPAPRHRPGQHAPVTVVDQTDAAGGVGRGPAVKYVRETDGTVHRVR
jgi:hypothetical protein